MKIRWFLLFITFCISLMGCKSESSSSEPKSFEEMMGKKLSCWQFVTSSLDKANLTFFESIYQRRQNLPDIKEKIPKVIHFIWLGPKAFPAESVKNLQSWIANHPDWTFKFWTDRTRHLPSPLLEECFYENWADPLLQTCYESSSNFAEKSDILRYQILLDQGGVYIDHDMQSFQPLDDLVEKYQMFCGLELPSDTPMPSSIHVTNSLIGSCKGHPVLQRCVHWIPQHWQEIERLYPGMDKMSVIARVANRTLWAFADSVRLLVDVKQGDMVFPAFYFNAITDEQAIYAKNLYAGSWFQNESHFEKMVRQRVMLLSKKANKTLLLCSIGFVIQIIGLGWIIWTVRKRKYI